MEYFYNQRRDYGYHDQPTHPTGHRMATIAMFLGVGAAITFWTVYMPMILGGLGIILAVLSRGFEKRYYSHARTALVFSSISLMFSLVAVITVISNFINNPDTLLDIGRQTDLRIMQTYGQTTEAILGDSYENMLMRLLEFFR